MRNHPFPERKSIYRHNFSPETLDKIISFCSCHPFLPSLKEPHPKKG